MMTNSHGDFVKNKQSPRTLIEREVFYPLKLASKRAVNHDTRIFRFELPTEDHVLGAPTGQHVVFSAEVNGKTVTHSYTPLTNNDDKGLAEFVIKIYFKTEDHPEGGRITQHLEKMKIGESINVRGPKGHLEYKGKGQFNISPKESSPYTLNVKKVAMIAGGSGIAPMLQLIRQVFRDSDDTTQLAFLFANQTEEDIILREELEELQEKHSGQFRVWYTVDRPSKDWKYSVGYVSAEMIQEHLFPPADDTIVLMCGRKPMVRGLVRPLLEGLGHREKQIFKY